jgi:hypothetical protein
MVCRLSGQGCVETPPPLDLFPLSIPPRLCQGILSPVGAPTLIALLVHIILVVSGVFLYEDTSAVEGLESVPSAQGVFEP